jgi:hypothetical protein
VEPLRLYLTFSIIFFALFKFSGVEIYGDDSRGGEGPAAIGAPANSPPPQAPLVPDKGRVELSDQDREIVRRVGAISPRLVNGTENFLRMKQIQQTEVAKRLFFSYTPYAIFLLMPVFALFLKLLYLGSGRRYGEHFLFALHSNAFAFFTMSLFILAHGWDPVRVVLLAWLFSYLPVAMQRVYGGSRLGTGVRWIVLLVLHLLSLVAAVFAVAMGGMVALAG